MTQEERIARGREAARIAGEGSVLNQAIAAVREEQTARMIAEPDPQERDLARAIVLGLGAVVAQLRVYITDAQVAEKAIEDAEKARPTT